MNLKEMFFIQIYTCDASDARCDERNGYCYEESDLCNYK